MSDDKQFSIKLANGKSGSFKDGYEMWKFFMKEKGLFLKKKKDGDKTVEDIVDAVNVSK